MTAMTNREFGLVTSREELLLRRRLLFRLLKDFDFSAPRFHGEMITPPVMPEQRARAWFPR